MAEHFWWGVVVILLSGAANGAFPLPMKYVRHWKWENTWLVFSITALLVLPAILALGFIPDLGGVYRSVPARALFYPIMFGFLWGIAQTTFGLGLKALGMALAFSIVAGLGALVGSLVPLLLVNPAGLLQPRGLLLFVSIPILLLGLYLYAQAGRARDREHATAARTPGASGMSFRAGLAICIFTGLVGPSWNLGFALGGDVITKSLEQGARAATASYAVWPLVLTAGFLSNLLYCVYLLVREKSWRLFAAAGWPRDAALGITMALLWLSGIVFYGLGAGLIGKYGTSVGFALFVSAQILSSNTLGILAGEWRGATPPTRRLLVLGVGIIVLSVIVLSLGGLFKTS